MLSEDKDILHSVLPIKQQVFSFSNITDFNSDSIKMQIDKIQDEVRLVVEGAIVDSSKLSLNFTV